MENTSIVPVMDVNNNHHDCYGYGGMWFLWIFVIIALMGGFGGNWGNRNGVDTFANGSMTRDLVSNEFALNDIKNGIRGVQQGLCDGFYAQNTTMLNGFNGVQRDLCQGFGNTNQNLMQLGYQLGDAIIQNRFAAQQCCCETNRNIDSVRAENYKNTCEVVNAINADGEKTRALLVANQIQDLRDKLADRDRDLMSANLQLGQLSQTNTLVNTLRPFPQPAYITCSPYQQANVNYGCNACASLA